FVRRSRAEAAQTAFAAQNSLAESAHTLRRMSTYATMDTCGGDHQRLAANFCVALGGQMADVDLRPVSLGEVLDRTFKLYKSHFWLFTGITALPFLLVLIAEVVISAMGIGRAPSSSTPPVSAGAIGGMIGGGVVVVLLYLLMFGAAHAATV